MAIIRDGLHFEIRQEIPLVPGAIEPAEPWQPARVTAEAHDHGRRYVVAMEAVREGSRRRNAVAFMFAMDVADPEQGHTAAKMIGEMLLRGWVQQMNGGPASWLGDGWATNDSATSRSTAFIVRTAD